MDRAENKRVSQPFTPEMLPRDVTAADTLYVTDRDLGIVYSNEEWTRFAIENKGEKLLEEGWNENVLVNVGGKQRDHWRYVYRLLLEGRLPHHQEVFDCSSPDERRVYQLRVTPARDQTGAIAWLIHHNVRIDDDSDPLDRVTHVLDELDDNEYLAEAFRQRIAHRTIRIASFDVARYFEPLEEIGGDLVWHREYPDGVTDLIHADVMGHGVSAGRVAAKMAVVLDELASEKLSPSGTVAALNRAMTRVTRDDAVMFATGICFRFEQDRSSVACCSFGHEGPVFSRAGPIQIATGYAVGLDPDEEVWPEVRLDLRDLGTRFLVFSDGVTEQFNADGEMFEIEGLHRAFQRCVDAPLRTMMRAIVSELSSFRGAALIKDDQTLVALDFMGADRGAAPPTESSSPAADSPHDHPRSG
jgi:hypothetical protein